MKVLILHNQYKIRGGEDIVMEAETALLRDHRHIVVQHIVSNEQISGMRAMWNTALNTSYSRPAKESVAEILQREKPDLVHVHNFFPLLTPSIFDACEEAHIPVLQTLHNYRITCANALLLRNGKPCELCIKGSPYQSVQYGCYRSSRLASLPVAHMIQHHRKVDTWNRSSLSLIAPTNFAKQKFVAAGVREDKIAVKFNFVKDPWGIKKYPKRGGGFALFVGRLSEEKGVETLLRASQGLDFPFKLIGDGELEEKLKSMAPKNVEFLGRRTREEVLEAMSQAEFLVCPTECYEGAFPLVLVEAMAMGLPLITNRIGAIPEILDGESAILVEPTNIEALRTAMDLFHAEPALREELSAKARKIYERDFTERVGFENLMRIYARALAK